MASVYGRSLFSQVQQGKLDQEEKERGEGKM